MFGYWRVLFGEWRRGQDSSAIRTGEYWIFLADGSLRGDTKMKPNYCIQATPDCALVFIVAQGSGAPDAERWTS